MKTTLNSLLVTAILLAITSGCKNEKQDNNILSKAEQIFSIYSASADFICPSDMDAIQYPKPWTKEVSESFTIPEAVLKNISTCGLIQTFFNQPWNTLGPWCSFCSDMNINGVQYFNNTVRQNAIITELFSREDALYRMLCKYIMIMQDLPSMENSPGFLYSFELLLASESMSNILTDNAGDDLLVLALRMIELKGRITEFNNENSFAATRHIIANILLQKENALFISSCFKNGALETFMLGYKVCYEHGKVEKYAKLYLGIL